MWISEFDNTNIFQLAINVLNGNIKRHTEPLTIHWRKNAGLLDQFHMKLESATATNTALTKYWFCVLFMNQYLKLPFELAWQKKPYLAKTLREPIDLMAFLSTTNANFTCNNQRQPLTALWSNGIQASSEWQYFSPMMLEDPVGAAIMSLPLLITTLFKCSGSTCAHWRPSSWWRSRRPPIACLCLETVLIGINGRIAYVFPQL